MDVQTSQIDGQNPAISSFSCTCGAAVSLQEVKSFISLVPDEEGAAGEGPAEAAVAPVRRDPEAEEEPGKIRRIGGSHSGKLQGVKTSFYWGSLFREI